MLLSNPKYFYFLVVFNHQVAYLDPRKFPYT